MDQTVAPRWRNDTISEIGRRSPADVVWDGSTSDAMLRADRFDFEAWAVCPSNSLVEGDADR